MLVTTLLTSSECPEELFIFPDESSDLTPSRTGSETVNHAVVAVGYGATAEGQPFWTVRNSWSTSWGEAGYFRLARGKNKCGLADCASYPIV